MESGGAESDHTQYDSNRGGYGRGCPGNRTEGIEASSEGTRGEGI